MNFDWFRRPRILVRSIVTLKEEELRNQIKSLSPAQFGAISQVITQLESEANDGAANSVANYGISASCVGGAEHLRMLQDRLNIFRESKEETPQFQKFVPRT
jgi:hypothetical protein